VSERVRFNNIPLDTL